MAYTNDQSIRESRVFRNNEPELRELERRLRNEYIRKNQMCQVKEKEYKKLQEEIIAKREAEIMLRNRCKEEEIHKNVKIKESERRTIYGKELQSQVKLEKMVKQLHQDEDLNDKKIIEENMLEIQKENERLLAEKRERIINSQIEMEMFQRVKQVKAEKQRLLVLEECQRIERALKEQDERLLKNCEENKRKVKEKEDAHNKLASKMLSELEEQKERTELIDKIEMHEMKTRHQEEALDEAFKNDHKTPAIGEHLKKQMDDKDKSKMFLKYIDEKFNDQIKSRLQKQDEVDLKHTMMCKEIQQKYSKDVKNQMEESVEALRRQAEFVNATNEYMRQYNKQFELKIEQEKKKMINEYRSILHQDFK